MATLTLDGKEFVYVLGGQHFNDVVVNFRKSVEMLTDKGWVFKRDMLTARTLFTATVVNNHIYAVGGFKA